MNARRHERHTVNGPAILCGSGDRGHIHVEMVDLSTGGACVRPHRSFDVELGETFQLVGEAMPWERAARLVAQSDRGLHLAFVDS